MLQEYVIAQTERVKRSPYAGLLSEKGFRRLESRLIDLTNKVAGSTVTRYVAQEASASNPFALSLPEMITENEKQRAIETIEKKLAAGELTFPKTLTEILAERLTMVTDAFLEMLLRMAENREAICDALTGGKRYEKIEDVRLSAGDTHCFGRSVTILDTDAGRLVYKPRDLRGDAQIHEIAERFFPEFAGIPRCIPFGDSFGVCEFIEKQRPEGTEEAKRFWYRMGGMAAFIKMMGSTDMHIENLTCHGGKPYILDLETVISPILKNEDLRIKEPELKERLARSPFLSGLMPNNPKGREYSPLMNTDEEGCAPCIDGKNVPAVDFLTFVREGYDTAYRRILENREAIEEMIRGIPDTIPARILMRNTQAYVDNLQKMYHHTAVSSQENREKTEAVLTRILSYRIRPEFQKAAEAEIRQMKRGDVPYVFATAGTRALYSDGEKLQDDIFEVSPKEHALETLRRMNEADELFDLTLIERAIRQYPVKLNDIRKPAASAPQRTEEPLSRETALREAERLLEEAFSLHIPSPEGRLYWGYINQGDYSFKFIETGLFNGYAGFGAFAAACLSVSRNRRIREMAERILGETVLEMKRATEYVRFRDFGFDFAPQLGESEGTGGIITGLELMRRYAPRKGLDAFDSFIDELLERTDYPRYGAPDRLIGMAGLLSVLCRFERYRGKKEIIRKAADRLLGMKTLAYEGGTLWKTLPDQSRPICGAGHGQAGIAEALFAAAGVLGEEKYAAGARDALAYEAAMYEKYREKFGTWADLRSYPPEGIMHGYCSGAPGTGILMERIRRSGFADETVEKLEQYARESTDRMSLSTRDHLCCGNSAIAEYYMSVGDFESAGRVLGAMANRREKEGTYRYMGYEYNNGLTPSLFYGIAGVGYEMLRYAFPDQIISVL